MADRKRKLNGTPVFIMISVILILLIAVFGISSANRRAAEQETLRTWQKESQITPVPTATVSGLRVTEGPDAVYTVRPVATEQITTYVSVSMTPVVLNQSTPGPESVTDTVLSYGSKGEEVRQLQQRLKELGYLSGSVDGDFGSGTRAAVKWFQQQHGLSVDGAAGKATKTLLFSADAQIAVATPTPEPVNVLSGDIPLLVNRDNPVKSDFEPERLVSLEDTIPSGLCTYKIKGLRGVKEAVDALTELLQAAHADGLTEWQISEAYRTWDRQEQIFNNQVNSYMNENGMTRSKAQSATRKTVADPGTSEHHTGLAFDITVPGMFFVDTLQYRWMLQNCWDYGFILRYTDEKESITGFLGEEWHFRYVGREHALRIKNSGLCLEEYVDLLNRQ